MSDELDFGELPDELRDVASRLRGLRPAAAKASEAESMYRAGWHAALAAHAASASHDTPSWHKSYFSGLASGALVSAALTAALMLGMAKPSTKGEAVPDQGSLAQGSSAPAVDRLTEQARHDEPARDGLAAVQVSAPMRTETGESIATSLLSPLARQQWREVLTQTAPPDTSSPSQPQSSGQPTMETLRSWSRDRDQVWF